MLISGVVCSCNPVLLFVVCLLWKRHHVFVIQQFQAQYLPVNTSELIMFTNDKMLVKKNYHEYNSANKR